MLRRILPILLLVLSFSVASGQDAQEPAADPVPVLREIAGGRIVDEADTILRQISGAMNAVNDELLDLVRQRDRLRKTLQNLDEEFALYRDAYAADEEGPEPPAVSEVASRLESLANELDGARAEAAADRAESQRVRLHETVGALRALRERLDGETYVGWRRYVEESVPEERRGAVVAALEDLQERIDAAAADLSDQLSLGRTELGGCQVLRSQVRDRREEMVSLLRRENLLLRGHSNITLEAIGAGIHDLVDLPEWIANTAQEAGAAVVSGAYTDEITQWSLATLLAVALLWFARRRLLARLRPAAELTTDIERSRNLALRLLGSLLWALLLMAPFVLAAHLLVSLPREWATTTAIAGYALGAFWFGRALARRLLPGPSGWSPIELEPRSAMLVRTGLVALAWLTVIGVPLAAAIHRLGYPNAGALEALWTLYKLLCVVVLLVFVLRRHVLAGFLPSAERGVGRVLRFLLAIVHPVLVLVGPLLLALDFLQYDVLAEFLLRMIGGIVVATAAGLVVFGTVWKGLAAWISSVVTEPPGATPETSRVDAALVIGRYVLTLLVLVGALFIVLLVKGGDLGAIRDVLDVDLPFQAGVEGKRLTWFNVVTGVGLLVLFLTAVPKVKLALERFVLPRTSLDSGLRYTISTLAGYVFAALGIYVGLVQIFDLGAIGYVFAALSLGIGFGLQEIVSNFVSGLILLFERPIKVGDLITVGTTEGWVTKINIRATTIQTRDNVSMLIPNKDFITQAVVNSVYGDTILRVRVNVGVAYGSDTALVKELLLRAAREHPVVLPHRPVEVAFRDFGASSLDFAVLCWIPEAAEHVRVASDLRFKIDQLFRENGVEIPFSQHDLHLRSIDDEAAEKLRGA